MTNIHAERARALVGCRFRAQGRDPSMGVDCIGLVACTFRIPEAEIARDYRLRGAHLERLEAGLREHFRRIPKLRIVAGDVLLFSVAADQMHLGIRTEAGLVHADAGLRRVVETLGLPCWPIVSAFRRKAR